MNRRKVLTSISAAALAAPLAGGLLGASAGAANAAGIAPADAGRAADLQALLDAEHAAGMPGLFAQVRNGDDTYRLASGTGDIASGRKPHANYLHRIGGASKSFAATTILHLVGDGLIDLDKPIGQYLPHLVPGDDGAQITVRMLLNHSSGLDDYMTVLFATPESIAQTSTRNFHPHELISIALGMPRVAPPGTLWNYASTNYVILGQLIEHLTRRPYAEVLHRRVLGPLGLHDTYASGNDRRIRGPHMEAYIPWTDGSLRDFSVFNMSWSYVGCDLVSTAADMNKFYRCLLSGQVLDSGLLTEMMTPFPFNPQTPTFYAGYGLGLIYILTKCGGTWGHDGLVVGHTTYSTHTADGVTGQMTAAENENFYEAIVKGTPSTNPIDLARNAFSAGAVQVCGGTAPAAIADRMHIPVIRDVDLSHIVAQFSAAR